MLMRVCSQCGKANGSDSQFCVKCGQNIASEPVSEMTEAGKQIMSQPAVRVMRNNGMITDIHIPLSSVIVLVFKFFLAGIPAVVLTTVLVYVLLIALRTATVFGVLGTLFSRFTK